MYPIVYSNAAALAAAVYGFPATRPTAPIHTARTFSSVVVSGGRLAKDPIGRSGRKLGTIGSRQVGMAVA